MRRNGVPGWLRFPIVLLAAALVVIPLTGSAPQKRSCYDCHKEAEAAYKKPFVHDPVARADCESCHKRHGFSQTLILARGFPELC
ncbi:MAG: hypothetical protein FD129_1731, partial [bacterium]